MTLKADILTDLAAAFLNSDDFAVDAVLNSTTTIPAIFDNAIRILNGVESLGPEAWCASSDVANVVHGNTLEISGTTYYVIGIQPDGTGMTLILLSEESI